jgi:hypothetical protein
MRAGAAGCAAELADFLSIAYLVTDLDRYDLEMAIAGVDAEPMRYGFVNFEKLAGPWALAQAE